MNAPDRTTKKTTVQFFALAQPKVFRQFQAGKSRCVVPGCPNPAVSLLVVVRRGEDVLREDGPKLTAAGRRLLQQPLPDGAARLAVVSLPACGTHKSENEAAGLHFAINKACEGLFLQMLGQLRTGSVQTTDDTDDSETNTLTTVTFFPSPPSH